MARILAVLVVITLAAALRLRAIQMLPVDYDEDDYLRAGQQYANAIRQGEWGVFTRENYRTEHPQLSKIVYGVSLLTVSPFPEIPDRPTTAAPDNTLPRRPLTAARTASALFGILEVGALAALNPLAGFFLAFHTWTIKYTSQVMLESVPSLTSLVVVLSYLMWKRTNKKGWLAVSAISLGLTAAAKYYYCISGVAVAADWLYSFLHARKHQPQEKSIQSILPLFIWGMVSILVFLVADPYLWPDPAGRLWQSISYHARYAQSEAVREAGYPFWQQLKWLTMNVPWHPGVFLVSLDILLPVSALLGVNRVRQRYPVFLIWTGLAIAFLLAWPTKWPQYLLMMTAPLAFLAGEGIVASLIEPFIRWIKGLRNHRQLSS